MKILQAARRLAAETRPAPAATAGQAGLRDLLRGVPCPEPKVEYPSRRRPIQHRTAITIRVNRPFPIRRVARLQWAPRRTGEMGLDFSQSVHSLGHAARPDHGAPRLAQTSQSLHHVPPLAG